VRHLWHRMLPIPLTGPTHHHEIARTQGPRIAAAPTTRPGWLNRTSRRIDGHRRIRRQTRFLSHGEPAGRSERQYCDNRIASVVPDRVAVPGNAVASVAVQRGPSGVEGALVSLGQAVAELGHETVHCVRQLWHCAVKSRLVDPPIEHQPPVSLPAGPIQQLVEEVIGSENPAGHQFHPRRLIEPHPLCRWETRFQHKRPLSQQSGLEACVWAQRSSRGGVHDART